MNVRQFGVSLTIIALFIATLGASVMAQGRGNGGGNRGGDATHNLIDLLGLPGDDLQSDAQFLTDRDGGGNILIAGNSHWYNGLPGTPPLLPVTWSVDKKGNLSQGDPVNLGVPVEVREVEVTGLNHHGVAICITRWAKEKDEDDNWIFPSYVSIPGFPWQEIPIPAGASRSSTWLDAINDAGQIIGDYVIDDPDDPDNRVSYTAMWQVGLDGTISGPVNIDDSTDEQLFRPNDLNNFGVMAGHLDGWPTIAWLENGVLQTVTLDSSQRFFGAEVEALNDFPPDDSRLTVVGSVRRDESGDYTAPDRGYAWRPFDPTNPTTLIGTFGGQDSESWAYDVNNSGQIVGRAEQKRGGRLPFLFDNGVLTDLNTLVDAGKMDLQLAKAINNQGDITGLMRIPKPVSEIHGFLLRLKDQ